MAAVNPAVRLRTRARDALLAAGGRGFVRFDKAGDLLISDAARRCANGQTLVGLIDALCENGFSTHISDGMIGMNPTDALIGELAADAAIPQIDWESPLHPAQSLAARWMNMPETAMTDCGRMLAIETLRLIWQPQERVMAGLPALRARAAAMLRERDTGGMRQAGAILAKYLTTQRGECI